MIETLLGGLTLVIIGTMMIIMFRLGVVVGKIEGKYESRNKDQDK